MSAPARKTSSLLPSSLLAAALLLLLVGERIFGTGASRNAATGLGAAVFAVAFALRAGAFGRAGGDVRRVEGRLLMAYVGVLCALFGYALSTEPVLDLLHLADDPRARVTGVLAALWPATLLVSCSASFFMELAYARMPIAASVELRRVRTAAYAGLSLGFCGVFLLSINYVATARDVRRDVSYFKTTEPSAGTRKLLAKLEAPVKAVLFFRRGDDVLSQVEPYFAALARDTKRLRYQVQDAALAPELARKHRISGNGSVLLLAGKGDAQKGQSWKIGNELTEARAQLRKLDGSFQQSFAKLTQPERTVRLTVGHGERNAKRDETDKGGGTRFLEEVWRRLNLKTDKLGMAQGLGTAVPEGTGAVVVLGPREKLMPEESRTLLEHVRKGGRLLLMVDPDVDDGLEPLLAGLGLARQPGALISDKHHMRHAFTASDKGIVYANSYSSHPSVTTASRHQSEVASIFVGAAALVKAAEDPTPKPSVTFPLRSAAGFVRDLDADFERDPGEVEESVNLVASVTFTDKAAGVEGRAIVIGDGDFMTDKVASNNGNVLVFVDSLAWLVGNEQLSAEVSSEEDVPIEHSQGRDKLWFYATTFGVPLPVAGLGLFVARRRRRSADGARAGDAK